MRNMMENKRKLYIVTHHYPFGNGEKTFIEPELKRLQATNKFDITIISTEGKNSVSTSEVDKDIKVVNIPYVSVFKNIKSMFRGIKYGIIYFFSKDVKIERLELKKEGFRLNKLIDSVNFYIQANFFYNDLAKKSLVMNRAVIYTYWCYIQTLAIALHKSELENVKLISRIHRFDLYDESNPCGRQPFRAIINNELDKLFFIAEHGLNYYEKRTGIISSEKHVLSRLGTECTEAYDKIRSQQEKWDDFLLVSCSNIIPLKRIEIIIEALSLIEKIRITWVHFGDGYKRKEMEKRASELLKDKTNIRYKFKGQTSNSEVLSFYRNHLIGCFITTSQSEGCPVSIQEAMSFGIPVIATGVGEIPYMVDGNGILLSKNPYPKEVAEAIRQMSNALNENMNRMRDRSRYLWEQYFDAEKNYSVFADNLLSLELNNMN